MSQALTGRSANRGECSQLCRLPYDVYTEAGTELAKSKHVLSLKDNDQSANLEALIDAGVSSFKIEGRLKGAAYVKNVTAFYRRKLDEIIARRPELSRTSQGDSVFTFEPAPEKVFNRGQNGLFRARPANTTSLTSSPNLKVLSMRANPLQWSKRCCPGASSSKASQASPSPTATVSRTCRR